MAMIMYGTITREASSFNVASRAEVSIDLRPATNPSASLSAMCPKIRPASMPANLFTNAHHVGVFCSADGSDDRSIGIGSSLATMQAPPITNRPTRNRLKFLPVTRRHKHQAPAAMMHTVRWPYLVCTRFCATPWKMEWPLRYRL